MKTIALLTDFGVGEYVGIMKGVILKTIKSPVNIVDIKHDIEPQNILQASWILSTCVNYFPEDTIYVCVVDPGVGGDRADLLIQTKTATFIGPNNGLFTHTLKQNNFDILHVYSLHSKTSSATFHGRDVFSLSAAQFANGDVINATEIPFQEIVYLNISNNTQDTIHIVSIDTFGNLISDTPTSSFTHNQLASLKSLEQFKTGQISDVAFVKTYEEGAKHNIALILLEGSNNTLEVSKVNGSAARLLSVTIGETLKLHFL
ncbi:hypothetical protein EIN_284120 [Entamoeba invadens IP1]|uniref:Adenosyl-chloride synthase n=1 Tax=Entamoeba invadens IP1 TaxID=370355 RepID=L7FJS4_ENTIV|nr:hypothetical protein EIN_284120 [Entamoeba invadens IP1]ELP84856.1 hypothetical protein EIN_284120 [Entamoeba invadens IP1]|eukprot:XP_004184202.1 hypothetical protein EIN_284120 [Entamoeba invadens IP1]